MFPRARMGKISPFNQKKLVNQNFRDLFVEDFGSIWLINLFGLRGRLDGAHQQARCGEAAGHHRRHDGREQGPWQPAPGPQHSARTTGDCVVTECPDNYRVSKVGALGKQYLPSANTRKT